MVAIGVVERAIAIYLMGFYPASGERMVISPHKV